MPLDTEPERRDGRKPSEPSRIPDQAIIPNTPGRFMRAIGARTYDYSHGKLDHIRFNWGEVSFVKEFGLELIAWAPDHASPWSLKIAVPKLVTYINLPFQNRLQRPFTDMLVNWGFTYRYGPDWNGQLFLDWGGKGKIVDMPWSLDHVRTDVLTWDGTWRRQSTFQEMQANEKCRATETHPYKYVKRNGEVQEVKAIIYVDEMEWRPRWTKWTPLFRKVRRSINVSFSGEVGERAGSWKGGCIGCGYDMRPGERPVDTLRRMERERRFD